MALEPEVQVVWGVVSVRVRPATWDSRQALKERTCNSGRWWHRQWKGREAIRGGRRSLLPGDGAQSQSHLLGAGPRGLVPAELKSETGRCSPAGDATQGRAIGEAPQCSFTPSGPPPPPVPLLRWTRCHKILQHTTCRGEPIPKHTHCLWYEVKWGKDEEGAWSKRAKNQYKVTFQRLIPNSTGAREKNPPEKQPRKQAEETKCLSLKHQHPPHTCVFFAATGTSCEFEPKDDLLKTIGRLPISGRPGSGVEAAWLGAQDKLCGGRLLAIPAEVGLGPWTYSAENLYQTHDRLSSGLPLRTDIPFPSGTDLL